MADIKAIPRVKSPGRDTADSDAWKGLRCTRVGELFTANWVQSLLFQGRIFVSSDADENDRVTGQTSYAATTPTFLLKVPTGTVAVPLQVNLGQAGTAAGGDISVVLAFDNIERYSTGGTSEAVKSLRTDAPVSNSCLLYSGATAANAGACRTLLSVGEIPAVAGAGTAKREDSLLVFSAFQQFIPPVLVGPSAFLVFSYAASTGPSWEWSIVWAEMPTSDFN